MSGVVDPIIVRCIAENSFIGEGGVLVRRPGPEHEPMSSATVVFPHLFSRSYDDSDYYPPLNKPRCIGEWLRERRRARVALTVREAGGGGDVAEVLRRVATPDAVAAEMTARTDVRLTLDLVAQSDPQVGRGLDTGNLETLRSELAEDEEVPLGRIAAALDAVLAAEAEEVFLLVDADMLAIRRWPLHRLTAGQLRGRPVAAEYGYMEEWGNSNGLAERQVHPTPPSFRPDAVGVPVLMALSDMARIVDEWYRHTLDIRRDPVSRSLTQDGGWTAEMYGYTFAAAEAGLVHDILSHGHLMLYPPMGFDKLPPHFIHYGIGYEADGHWFDKHDWFPDRSSCAPHACDCDWLGATRSVGGRQQALLPTPLHRRSGAEQCVIAHGALLANLCTHLIFDSIARWRDAHCAGSAETERLVAAGLDIPTFTADYWSSLHREEGCTMDPTSFPPPHIVDAGGYFSPSNIAYRLSMREETPHTEL
jgi:hypothetical protein